MISTVAKMFGQIGVTQTTLSPGPRMHSIASIIAFMPAAGDGERDRRQGGCRRCRDDSRSAPGAIRRCRAYGYRRCCRASATLGGGVADEGRRRQIALADPEADHVGDLRSRASRPGRCGNLPARRSRAGWRDRRGTYLQRFMGGHRDPILSDAVSGRVNCRKAGRWQRRSGDSRRGGRRASTSRLPASTSSTPIDRRARSR